MGWGREDSGGEKKTPFFFVQGANDGPKKVATCWGQGRPGDQERNRQGKKKTQKSVPTRKESGKIRPKRRIGEKSAGGERRVEAFWRDVSQFEKKEGANALTQNVGGRECRGVNYRGEGAAGRWFLLEKPGSPVNRTLGGLTECQRFSDNGGQ